MKIQNKSLFWTGLAFQIVQLSGLAIFGLTLLDWSWFTKKVLLMIIAGTAILAYNALSILMMYFGCERNKKKKRDKKKKQTSKD